MAREVHRLSAKAVEKMKQPGYYCDGGGLYLQASPGLRAASVRPYLVGESATLELCLSRSRDMSRMRTLACSTAGYHIQFGVLDMRGKDIPFARLQTDPSALHCQGRIQVPMQEAGRARRY